MALISLEDALARMLAGVTALPTEDVAIGEAHGRTGNLIEAKSCLAQARDMIRTGGERWYEPECWRVAQIGSAARSPARPGDPARSRSLRFWLDRLVDRERPTHYRVCRATRG